MSIELFFGSVSYALHIGHKTPAWQQLSWITLTKVYWDSNKTLAEVEYAESLLRLF